MALLPGTIASRQDGRIEIQPQPVRLHWQWTDLVASDGHTLHVDYSCSLHVRPEPVERQMLAEIFLHTADEVSDDTIQKHFSPALQAAAQDMLGQSPAAQCLEKSAQDALRQALLASANRIAFSCGLEIIPPVQVIVACPSLAHQRTTELQRTLAREHARQREADLTQSAQSLSQFLDLCRQMPQLSASTALQRVNPEDQAALLESLFRAGCPRPARWLMAVAGHQLLRIDLAASKPIIKSIELPASLGPLRSLHRQGDSSQWLIGAQRGIWQGVVEDEPASAPCWIPYEYPHCSALGFTTPLRWRDRVWACHSEVGLIAWPVALDEAPCLSRSIDDPADLPSIPANLVMNLSTLGGAPRGLVVLDDNRLLLGINGRLARVNADAQFELSADDGPRIIGIWPLPGRVRVIHEDGTCIDRDRQTLAEIDRLSLGHRISAVAPLPWMDRSSAEAASPNQPLWEHRLLLATAQGPILCMGGDDSLITHYLSAFPGSRMVAGGAGLIAALSADRQHAIVWQAWNGRRPHLELPLASFAHHRLADIAIA